MQIHIFQWLYIMIRYMLPIRHWVSGCCTRAKAVHFLISLLYLQCNTKINHASNPQNAEYPTDNAFHRHRQACLSAAYITFSLAPLQARCDDSEHITVHTTEPKWTKVLDWLKDERWLSLSHATSVGTNHSVSLQNDSCTWLKATDWWYETVSEGPKGAILPELTGVPEVVSQLQSAA